MPIKNERRNATVFVLVSMVCIFLVGFHPSARAQQYSAADTATVLKLVQACADSDVLSPSQKLQLAEEAISISNKLNYRYGIGVGLIAKGRAEQFLGKPDEAIKLYFSGLDICKENGNKNVLARVHGYLGSSYNDKGDYTMAIPQFDTALMLYSSLSDNKGLAKIYHDLGNMTQNMGEFDKAEGYQLKALSLFSSLHMPLRVCSMYVNIAGTCICQKKYPEALRYLYAAVHLSDSMHAIQFLPTTYMNLGLCYRQTGKKDSAFYYYFKSLDLFKKAEDIPNEIVLLCDIGAYYGALNKLDEAEKYIRESLDLAEKTSNLSVVLMDENNLSGIYEMRGEYKKSLIYRDSAYAIKDSIYSQQQAQAISDLTTKYETKEVEQKNDALQKENSLQKLRLQRKNILVYSAFGAAILCLIIGLLVVRQNKLKANQQKLELEQKQLLAQMNPHFIFNCLNSIQRFVMENDKLNANRYLADFALLMRQTLDNSKDGIISLTREIEYLENYLSFEHMRFKDKFTYKIEVAPGIDTDKIDLPSMIIQPFVENAIRHGLCNLEARQGLLSIRFYVRKGFLYCEVEDNGIGMDEARKLKEQAYIKYQSHGMDLTRKRLALVSKMQSEDYKIFINSKKDADQKPEGTVIIIKFPLQA